MKIYDPIAASMAPATVPACDAAGVVATAGLSEGNGEVFHGLAAPEIIAAGDHAVAKAW